jgi:hypothetical protein
MIKSEIGWHLVRIFRSGEEQFAIYYGVQGFKFILCEGNKITAMWYK